MGKKVLFGEEARNEMRAGIDVLANAVKVTLGPRGRNVAIEREYGPPLVTKDGVTVARNILLSDRLNNMGAQLIRSVAAEANNEAGDGTTTATVLAQRIFNQGLKYVSEGKNPVLIKRGIDLAVQQVSDKLRNLSIKVDSVDLVHKVANISANNDEELGGLIAEAISVVGEDGLISVEEAAGSTTEVRYTDGLKLHRGWLNEGFITNSAKMTCEMEDCFVLASEKTIQSISELLGLLNQVVGEGKPLLIITRDISAEALSHLVINAMQKNIRCCVVKTPGFGDDRRAFINDVCVLTGATLCNDGQDFKSLTLDSLGKAGRVIVSQSTTSILNGAGEQASVEGTIANLRSSLSEEGLYEEQREIIRARISRLSGGVAVFRVGGVSEGEMRERKDRVEDAIHAVQSALIEGVVPGGGAALIHCMPQKDSSLSEEYQIGFDIILAAIKEPFTQISRNAGLSLQEIDDNYRKVVSAGDMSGYDALNLEFVENMFDRGVVDPARVVRTALEHAASASGTLLTTEVSIFRDTK